MEHTFDTVDEKVAECEFFLAHMAGAGMDMFAFKCYLSAYLAAARTTTLALQQFRHIAGFQEWYQPHQQALRESPLAKFFLDTRNDHLHGGPHPVTAGRSAGRETHYFFDDLYAGRHARSVDVLTLCRDYFVVLLEVVYDCYVVLGCDIDPQQYLTKEHFDSLGRNIDDAEIEVWGWIMDSLAEEGFTDDDRWHALRGKASECKINHLFYGYLGKVTPRPIEPEHYADFDYSPEENGWTHVPAGYRTLEEYWQAYPARIPLDLE